MPAILAERNQMMLTDDQYRAMTYQCPRLIPISAGILPSVWMKHRDQMDALCRRHPLLFPHYQRPENYDEIRNDTYHSGNHVDEWGCVWSNVHAGNEAIVTHHPVPTREDVHKLKLPAVVPAYPKHGFMYLRLADLRGFEELMLDFAEEAPELQRLIDLVLEQNLKIVAGMITKMKPGEMVYFGDDLGMQTSLAMSAAQWRKYLKPAFMEIYRPFVAAGMPVYMHTDGCIHEIVPDLVDCGCKVINPQFRANGMENLIRVFKGKVCCNLDLDRQLFPFASPGDLDAHVKECIAKLGSREGGLWVSAEINDDIPLENVDAIFGALEKYRGYWAN